MTKTKIEANDETNISEITISPDGRVFVFGASEPLLDFFAEIGWRDDTSSPNRAAIGPREGRQREGARADGGAVKLAATDHSEST